MWKFGLRWGKQLRPFLPVLAICLLAIWPFFSRPSLPNNTDAELHLFRLVELSRLIRAGILYPRWAPDFYFGYGYPIFNYYAPLAYYVGVGFDLLPAVGPVTAVKAVFVLSMLAGGLGTFALTRLYWGEAAGTLAAALYVYAPYVQTVDPHARGVLAESLSLGLLPCALAALAYLHHSPGRWRWVGAVILTGTAFLAHNLMAMVFGGVFLGWLVWQTISMSGRNQPPKRIHATALSGAALLLGIGSTAFFWLPVALERSLINITSVVGESGSHFAYANNFLSATNLLAAAPLHDWGAISPNFTFGLGLMQWVMGAAGGIFWLFIWLTNRHEWASPGQLKQALFFVLAAVTFLFLMVPASAPLWQAIPLLPFLQFPWRLLGPAALMLAVVGGSSMVAAARQLSPSKSNWFIGGTMALILLQAAPLAQVLPWEPFGDPSIAALTRQEISGRWLGTTSTADFVPGSVDVIPEPHGQLLKNLLDNQTPDRINYTSIPAGATIEWQQIDPLHMRYGVDTTDPFLLRLFLFDFAGWTVKIDGTPARTEIGRPEGFLVVPVPAGSHQIDVQFTTTPARQWGWIITATALILTAAAAWQWPRFSMARSGPENEHGLLPSAPRTLKIVFVCLGIAVLLIPGRWLRLHSTGLEKQRVDIPLQGNFSDQINLIGADSATETVRPGETLEITLYWKAARPQEINFQSFIHLLSPEGVLVTQSDKLNPGEFPTRQWPTDKYVLDRYEVTIPVGTPPGQYTLTAGLWVAAEGWRLPVIDAAGQQIGDNFPITTIEVR